MNRTTHTSNTGKRCHIACAVALSLAVSASAWGQSSKTTAYELNPGSTYQTGCFPPCLCPLSQEYNIGGTFDLSFVGSDLFFDYYAVTDVDWTVMMAGGTSLGLSITGSGSYTIGGDFALAHLMVLELKIDDDSVQHFHSGLALGGAEFPSIKIALTINDRVCHDTVIIINASPTGACCHAAAGVASCAVGTAAACADQGGEYQGDGTTCPTDASLPCEAPTGACCAADVADIACSIETETRCQELGGRFQGDGSTCPSDPKVACGLACDVVCPTDQACFSGCGELVSGVECVLFQADSGGLFIVENLGEFVVGDRVAVTGCHDPTCSSVCMQGDGCVFGNSIEPCGKVCGGFAGIPCDGAGEFCKLPVGRCCCDFQGVCTAMPEGCPENYDPVCGCDGRTYGNECEADAAGISVDHAGECGIGCRPTDDGFGCVPAPCSVIPEVSCSPSTLHLDVSTGAVTVVACECLDFNDCHIEFGDASPFATGNCPDGGTCEVVGKDTDNDGIDDTFEAVCGPIGACCGDISASLFPYPVCGESSRDRCLDAGGVFLGAGSTCSPVAACCLSFLGESYCVETDPACCLSFGGVPQGADSSCSDAAGEGACGKICGGIAGIPCDNDGEFCKLPDGQCCCDFQGVCTVRPEACPENYDPVCGCDDVTYGNECEADAASISIDYPGECGTGACCLPTGTDTLSCLVGTQAECLDRGGSYQGDGATCSFDATVPCGAPTGACCVSASIDPDSTCTLTTEGDCTSSGGSYQGDHTACELASCHLPPSGACCLGSAAGSLSCVIGTPEECDNQGGAYQGDDSTCPVDPSVACGVATGGCCFSSDDSSLSPCAVMTPEGCMSAGGVYQGDDIACDSNTCGCCFPDGTCTNMPESVCAQEGGALRLGTVIPAVSTWGVVAMTLLLLTAGTITLARRREAAGTRA